MCTAEKRLEEVVVKRNEVSAALYIRAKEREHAVLPDECNECVTGWIT